MNYKYVIDSVDYVPEMDDECMVVLAKVDLENGEQKSVSFCWSFKENHSLKKCADKIIKYEVDRYCKVPINPNPCTGKEKHTFVCEEDKDIMTWVNAGGYK